MSLLLLEGYEDGLDRLGRAAYSNLILNASYARTGSLGARVESSSQHYTWNTKSGDEHVTMVFGWAMKHTATPGGTTGHLVTFYSDNGSRKQIELRPQPNGSFVIYSSGPGALLTTNTGLFTTGGSWHYFELKFTIDDTVGSVDVHWDGVSVGSVSGIDTRNAGTTGKIDSMIIQPSSGAGGWYTDDMYLFNGAGTLNNDFAGDSRVYTLFPNGNGNYSQLIGSDGNSTDNYLLVDENPTPSSGDYAGDSTAGNKDTYTFDDLTPSVGTIHGVVASLYAAKSDAGTKHARPVIRRSSTDSTGTDVTLATGYTTYEEVFEEDPVAAAAWTISTVNASEFGFEVRN